MRLFGKYVGMKIAFAFMAIAFVALFGLVVMLLWNWLMPMIFGLPELTYLQAAGLLLLSKIFFSGGWKKGHRGPGGRSWKNHYMSKWASMTPEEKERMKEKYRNKYCGFDIEEQETDSLDSSNESKE